MASIAESRMPVSRAAAFWSLRRCGTSGGFPPGIYPNGGRITRAGILATAEFTVVHLAAAAPHHVLGFETHAAGR